MAWHKNVFSSNVQTVGYDEETQEMVITFSNGRQYAYEGVPEHVAHNLSNSVSVGTALNAEIKGRYPYRKLT